MFGFMESPKCLLIILNHVVPVVMHVHVYVSSNFIILFIHLFMTIHMIHSSKMRSRGWVLKQT